MVEVLEPQTKVKIAGINMLVEEYKWRVFHVVRMVWDHSMPPGHQTSFRNRYTFPDFYSGPYMALTVRLMLPALFHHRDLEPYMEYWLKFMHERLMGNPPQILFVRMIGYASKYIAKKPRGSKFQNTDVETRVREAQAHSSEIREARFRCLTESIRSILRHIPKNDVVNILCGLCSWMRWK